MTTDARCGVATHPQRSPLAVDKRGRPHKLVSPIFLFASSDVMQTYHVMSSRSPTETPHARFPAHRIGIGGGGIRPGLHRSEQNTLPPPSTGRSNDHMPLPACNGQRLTCPSAAPAPIHTRLCSRTEAGRTMRHHAVGNAKPVLAPIGQTCHKRRLPSHVPTSRARRSAGWWSCPRTQDTQTSLS